MVPRCKHTPFDTHAFSSFFRAQSLESVCRYIRDLYKDVLPHFPDSYLHLGGDEVNPGCWGANKAVLAWLAERKLVVSDLQGCLFQLICKKRSLSACLSACLSHNKRFALT
jgi:hypothetical protein